MSISPSQFKKILTKIDQKRLKNQQVHYNRKDSLYKTFPELKATDDAIASLTTGATRQIIENPTRRDQIQASLQQEIKALSKKKEDLLVANGYDPDYLKPLFDCKDCGDTGYVDGVRCHCLQKELMHYAYGQSNIGEVLRKENFDSFLLDFYSDQSPAADRKSPREMAARNYKVCYDFAVNFTKESKNNLLLHGQAGLGKTFLCNAIAKEVLDQGYSVIYLTAFHLFRIIAEYRFRNDDDQISYDDLQSMYDCDLLIIDDLGTENANSFTTSELFSLINSRLLEDKPVVISTNLTPGTLGQQYTDRIVSRILGSYLSLGFTGSDIRIQKKFKK